MTGPAVLHKDHPDLANPLPLADDYDSQAAFLLLLARLEQNQQLGRDLVDLGLALVTDDGFDIEDRHSAWGEFRSAVRASAPDDIEELTQELLGGRPVEITYDGTDENDTAVSAEIRVVDPAAWIHRRHTQGWTALTVSVDGNEIGGITRDADTDEPTVWTKDGAP